MALILADRVQEAGTANTTVSFTLSGAVAGFQSFSIVGNGNTTYYAATDGSGNWEVGIGTYSITGPTLTRTTILSSSNSGSAVTFSGAINVFVTYPSEKSVNLDANGNVSALSLNISALTSSNTSNFQIGGALSFSDTGIVSNSVGTTNSYLQAVLQNKSNGSSASTEFIAYNDQGTATTNFATVGINSSGYSGTGSINAAGYGYFLTGSTDLVLGTIGANSLHIAVNSSATDSMLVNGTTGLVSFPGTGAILLPKGTTAQQPAGVSGYIRYNTDSNTFEGYNGSAWSSVGVIVSATAPASPSAGQLWYDSTNGVTLIYYNNQWVEDYESQISSTMSMPDMNGGVASTTSWTYSINCGAAQ